VSQFIGNMFAQQQVNLSAVQLKEIKEQYCHVTEDYATTLK